jgi:hypothetical protein
MKVFLKSSLGRKLVLTMLATSSASLLIASLSLLSYDVMTFRQNVANHLGILADITGSNVAAALTYHDPKSADLVLKSLHAEPNIVASRVYRKDGTPFASYVRDFSLRTEQLPARLPVTGTNSEQERVTLRQPITFDQEVVGYVYLESDLKEVQFRDRNLFFFVLLLTAACSAAAFFVALMRIPASRAFVWFLHIRLGDRGEWHSRKTLCQRSLESFWSNAYLAVRWTHVIA